MKPLRQSHQSTNKSYKGNNRIGGVNAQTTLGSHTSRCRCSVAALLDVLTAARRPTTLKCGRKSEQRPYNSSKQSMKSWRNGVLMLKMFMCAGLASLEAVRECVTQDIQDVGGRTWSRNLMLCWCIHCWWISDVNDVMLYCRITWTLSIEVLATLLWMIKRILTSWDDGRCIDVVVNQNAAHTPAQQPHTRELIPMFNIQHCLIHQPGEGTWNCEWRLLNVGMNSLNVTPLPVFAAIST